MIERIAAAIARYGMFAAGERAGVAVSGGADSVCLLHALVELAPRWRLALTVLHVNHELRGSESDEDEAFVRDLAARLRLPFECRRVDVGRVARETRDNLEQAARRVRREFFLEFPGRVALGHTASDQAETVLFRFLRGAGTAGLAGMRPVAPEGFVRPLIEITRPEVEAFLGERGIAWRDDSTNAARDFARNRIRHDLLPALTRDWNPALPETLAGMARVARDEEDYWDAELSRLLAGNLVERPPAVLFRTDWLGTLPRAAARRAIRRAIAAAKGDLRTIDLRHIESVLDLAASAEGSGRLQIPGLDVFRSFDWVRLAPPGLDTLENRNYEFVPDVPGKLTLPEGSLCFELVRRPPMSAAGPAPIQGMPPHPRTVYNGKGSELDWGRISGSLVVRNWRPGDHYRPVGHANEAKIKVLFQQARIPLWERRKWPVITCRDTIVWAAGFGPAAEYAAGAHTRSVLRIQQLTNHPQF
ncbi:MAG: tRNA lysidine(34) synthetase TilS [Acidobacteriota bacterium]